MTTVKDRPLSDAQMRALAALSRHGYIVKATGSFLETPIDCQVPVATFASLQKRGIGKPGTVTQGLLDVEALLREDVQSPVVIERTKTPSFTHGGNGVHGLSWDGYSIKLYRSPNSGNMIFEIDTPEGYDDQIDVWLNDREVNLP